MTGREVSEFFQPWTGLAVGVLAAGFAHQFGAEGAFDHCRAISPIPLLAVCVIAIIVIVLGAFVSWRVVRDDAETQARRVIAIVSVGAAALFVFAIILPMIASLVLPPCFQ